MNQIIKDTDNTTNNEKYATTKTTGMIQHTNNKAKHEQPKQTNKGQTESNKTTTIHNPRPNMIKHNITHPTKQTQQPT